MRVIVQLAVAALGLLSASPAGSSDAGSATLRFRDGRQTQSVRLREPSGVILLYRIEAPFGAEVRAFTQLPGITVPLRIATSRVGPTSACAKVGARIRCSVGEEWCPMPVGTWHVRIDKLAGPAGDVTVEFRVGPTPSR